MGIGEQFPGLKTFQRGPRTVLRSTDPDGVSQELYAYLITYQAIRTLIVDAADTAGVDVDRLSFTTTLRAVRRWITTAATATCTALTAATHAEIAEIAEIAAEQHERRNRSSPRAVKRSQASYPAKRHATSPTSTTVDYLITHIPDPVTSGNPY